MTHPERPLPHHHKEHLDPRRFYAAYIFESAQARQKDVATVITQAQQLGYPVRYWWLSDALYLDDAPDRLIVCVHHAAMGEDAGMDLYTALKEQEIEWDFLEAAAVDEYRVLGNAVENVEGLLDREGTPLFPSATPPQHV
ncbi:MAG: hypothetical protein ACP5J4_12425 [Anaerolineae bacterium]